MKSLFIFLAGALSTFVLAGLAALILFSPPASVVEQSAPAPDARIFDAGDRFVISGTITVPNALKEVVLSGKGQLSVVLMAGDRRLGFIVDKEPNPSFPYKFSYSLSKNELSRDGRLKSALGLFVYYNPNNQTRRMVPGLYTEPIVFSMLYLPFTDHDFKNKNLPDSFDVGDVAFLRHYPYSIATPCLSEAALLAGKVSASPKFLQEHGHEKFALFVYEEPYRNEDDSRTESRILYEQFLDFSKGPNSFSVPAVKGRFPYYLVFASKCESADSLSMCVRRALPLWGPNRNRYAILSADLKAPYCGTTNFQGTIGSIDHDLFIRMPGEKGPKIQ